MTPSNYSLEIIERAAWEDQYRACPPDLAARLGFAWERYGGALYLQLAAIDHGQFNRCFGLGLAADDDAASAAQIADAVARFRAAGIGNAWFQVAPGPYQPACEARLTAAGLRPHARRWAKFARDAAAPAEIATDLTIVVADHRNAAAFAATVLAGFGLPPALATWPQALVGRDGWQCFIAYAGDEPAAAAALFTQDGMGWLGIDATRPEFRGRGGQSALQAARIAAGASLGVRGFATETGVPHPGEPGPSFANIRRAGFMVAYERANWALPEA